MKYRKKPVVIEARHLALVGQFDCDGCAIVEWINGEGGHAVCDGRSIYINTLEGQMRGDQGDWVIQGVKGEFYPCKPDIFAEIYEAAEAPHD